MTEFQKVDLSFPQSEMNPLSYKPLPRMDQLRSGEANGIKVIQESLKELVDKLERRGDSLETVNQEELFQEIVQGKLHCPDSAAELPGIAMAIYWLLDRVGKKDWIFEGSDHIVTWADIYIMMCAIQRNNFRWVLEFHYIPRVLGQEEWRETTGFAEQQFGAELPGFPPEGFRADPWLDKEGNKLSDWDLIKEADEILEKGRQFVLSHALPKS